MKITKKYLVPIIFVALLIAVCFGGYELGRHHKSKAQPEIQNQTTQNNKTSGTTTKQVPAPSYHVGDTQKDGSLSITLDGSSGATTMGMLPPNETVFSVDITVVNNGTEPFSSKDAFVSLSSVYTQVGTDTSTGQYSPAFTTPCFGGGDVIIPPSQSVKGCVQFMVPKNALVDTYFYDNLKWYL